MHELKYEWTYEELIKANAVLQMKEDLKASYDAYSKENMPRFKKGKRS